jgi:MFS family permease
VTSPSVRAQFRALTALVGVALGVRTLSRQGLFLVGGTAADRLGCRPVIVLGSALRVLAFGLFAVVTSPVGIMSAAVLTAFAGALFNPAVRAYLSREAVRTAPAPSRCSTRPRTRGHSSGRCWGRRCSPWGSPAQPGRR